METKKKKPAQAGPVISRYFKAARKYPWLIGIVLVSALAVEIAGLIAPLYLGKLIDQLSTFAPGDAVIYSLLTIVGMLGAVRLASWVSTQIQYWSMMRMTMNVIVDLSNQAFQNLLSHSHNFFVSNFAGSLTKRVNRYAYSFEGIFDTLIYNFLSTIVFTIGVIYVLSTRSPLLGLGVLIWTLVFIWIQYVLVKWRQPLRIKRNEMDTKMTGVLSDSISNQQTVNLFATWKYEQSIFANVVALWKEASLVAWRADNLITAIQSLFVILIEVLLLGGAVYLWQQGLLSVGDFVLIQVYILGLVNRIWGIGNSMRRLYDNFAAATEMIEILETPLEIADRKNATELKITAGEIKISEVDFGFDTDKPLLQKFTLTVTGGERVALIGPSGAGKSTITKLLLRLYDVTGGSIVVDDQNIAEVTQHSLRTNIAFVPQEPVLFHRSLMDNIRYGRLDATDEEVIEASKKAHCHEFISALKEGYETHVGERGVKLSGGERQRVAIARAILKNAPILILDEATSSLDSESEHYIQQALDVLMEGKTVVIIAHRLSTIMKMDRIVVIQKGTVIDSGTHSELLKKEGLYKKLWSIQAGGFIPEE